MKLTKLADVVNSAMLSAKHPENIDVVITTVLPYATCGQLPCTGVLSANMGFDWEAGQFRITPEKSLHTVDQIQVKPKKDPSIRGVYRCALCGQFVGFVDPDPYDENEKDHYCRSCGTAVLWEEED